MRVTMLRSNAVILAVVVFVCLFGISCSSKKVDEKLLASYAEAARVYNEGRFKEASEILAGIDKFTPALVLNGKAFFFLDKNEEAEK
jgi:outer membrane protein assembly factor BamD (BamD/ComL family)